MNSEELKELARTLNGIANGEKYGILLLGTDFFEDADDPIELAYKGYRVVLKKDFDSL